MRAMNSVLDEYFYRVEYSHFERQTSVALWPVKIGEQAEKAKESQFKDQAALTELQIAQQIRTSYALLNTSFIGVQSAEQAYHSAELAHEAALARFAVGVGDITSVVQAINLLSSAATQKSHAILNYNNAIVELYRYSATWPETSKEELDQRIKMMRNQPNSKSTIETTP